jgi:hypothetical protein
MPLPEPQEYQMLLDLQTALLAIAVSSGSFYDVPAGAVKLDANANIEALIGDTPLRPYIVIDVKPETRTYDSMPKLVQVVRPLTIYWVQKPADANDTTKLQTFFRGCSDVERAIAKDISRGGLAIDTKIIDSTPDVSTDSSEVIAVIHTELRHRRTYGAP